MKYLFKKQGAEIGFNANHIASLTEAQWLEEAKGQYEVADDAKGEEKALKTIHKECVKLVGKASKDVAPEAPVVQ